jgi:adenylate kinase
MDQGDDCASLAVEMFVHRLVATIDSMVAVLGGLDVLVFTGGFGEHSPRIRDAVASRLGYLGLASDVEANARAESDADLTRTSSQVRTLVLTAREDPAVLADVRCVLAPDRGRSMPEGSWDTRVKRLVLLGAPGAGKGTQAVRLAERLGVPHVASGELLRRAVEAGTSLGMGAGGFMDRGELVPDDLFLQVVLDRPGRPDAERGLIVDGFPRTPRQAEALDAELAAAGRALERAVELRVPTDQLLARIARRGRLDHRTDDRDGVVENRLRVYLAETAPLVDYYRARGLLVPVDGVVTVGAVADRIEHAIERSVPRDVCDGTARPDDAAS